MKKLSFLIAILPMLFCACSSFNEENYAPIIAATPDLQAGFADDTRTYVENNKYLRWHEDDRLTAFYGNTLNRQYKFNGKTGANSGTFSLVPSGELGTGNAFNRIYAVYPYNETATITEDGEISLMLPAVQSYAENSFGKGANTMIAVTENLEDTFLAFKNACGYLKLKLYNAEGATIKSVEVKGNNNEKIAGAATANIVFGEVPQLTMAYNATTNVTIDCGDGITLGATAEAATEFLVVLPETTFTKGLTIKATNSKGGVFEKSTENTVIITRNNIQPMAAVAVEIAPGPANNEIWYTNGSTTQSTTPYATYVSVFGAKIVSNTYDAENECWVIKFDGDVASIGDDAFYNCSSLTSVTIGNSVTSIGDDAFCGCSSLTNVTIGNKLTSIGYQAFRKCSSLTSVTIPNNVTSIGERAFYECSNLTSVIIGNGVSSIGCLAFESCEKLASLTIGNKVTSIGRNAFRYCSSLTSVTIPDSVTEIGSEAFRKCSSLTSVIIGNGVISIGGYAFTDCDSLVDVTIGNNVTSIEAKAFYGCNKMANIYCKATTPPAIYYHYYIPFRGENQKWGSFPFNSNLKIYVPNEAYDIYTGYTSVSDDKVEQTNWSKYISYITPCNFE